MGCNGSKHDVATNNTTASSLHPLLRKPSDEEKTATIPEADGSSGKCVEKSEKRAVADVTDIVVNSSIEEGCSVKMEEYEERKGKLVSKESPDRYFSSRKDEEVMGSISGEGLEFYSPAFDSIVGHQINGPDEKESNQVKEDDKDEALVDGSGDKNGVKQPSEETSEKEHVDLKEPILIEEVRVEDVIVNEANPNVEEINKKNVTADESKKGP